MDAAAGGWRQRMLLQKSLMAPKRAQGEMASPPAHRLKYNHQSGVNAEPEILI